MASEHLSSWEPDLLPHIVDRRAREQPSQAYGLWPTAQSSYEGGHRTINYGQLGNVMNGLAWWIVDHVGSPPYEGDAPVLTYVGPNDVRLTAMILASVKAGCVLFLTSPRNSPDAHNSLFTALKCQTLVTTDPTSPLVRVILDSVNTRCLTIPSLEELLAERHALFPYDKSFQSARWDPLCIIHTSGSTGMPKPLVWAHEYVARQQICSSQGNRTLDSTSIDKTLRSNRVMVTVPPFHGAGVGMYLFWAIPFNMIPIAPPASGIVTAKGLAEALEQTPAEVAVLVPSVIAELAQDPKLLSRCAKHLRLILYIGGDLPQRIGDNVAAQIPLRCWWGASECGIPHQIIPPGLSPRDWRYIRFHPAAGAVFDPIADGNYELVMRRSEDLPQACFSIPGQDQLVEYRTKDLFQPHPSIQDAWCWRARADDIIVFLNGEKTNPVTMEQYIVAQIPDVVSGALVFGTQRFQAALLIELAASQVGRKPLDTAEQAKVVEDIWPIIQAANKAAPAHARIEKGLVLILPGALPRAGKGTIQRAASAAQYRGEIDALYTNAELGIQDTIGPGMAVLSIDKADTEAVQRFISESVAAVTGWPDPASGNRSDSEQAIQGSSDTFFDRGMDSLMALQLVRMLRRGLRLPDLALATIYSHPTIHQLQAAITSDNSDGESPDSVALMQSLLDTYNQAIEDIPKPRPSSVGLGIPSNEPLTVVLTGSTGTIGTFLLRSLLARPEIRHVICLNRSKDGGRAAQLSRFDAAGFNIQDLEQQAERVTFLQANLSLPLLGLDEVTYSKLRQRLDLIIHNAWPVNFNLGLAAFVPQFAGLINLFQFACGVTGESTPSCPVRLVFVSSVSAVGGLAADLNTPVPEKTFTSLDTPYINNGYAQSKFLSEMLCENAAKSLAIDTMVFRVGQVAGATGHSGQGGEWNRNEWFPSLVIGSLDMKCLPDSLGAQFSEIDWIPVDTLADVLADLALSSSYFRPEVEAGSQATQSNTTSIDGPSGAQVFNVRNPYTTSWEFLLPTVIKQLNISVACGHDVATAVVTPAEWLARLIDAERKTAESGTSSSNPALRLLGFYQDSLWGTENGLEKSQLMAVDKSLAKSVTLRGMQAVGPNLVRKWVREWMVSVERTR